MRNILVVPSYKRPHYLLRLLESIEKYVPEIDEVMAVVMPEEADISMFEAKVFHFGLNILKQPQMVCGTARNFVIKKAIEKLAIEDDDIIIITDDDVVFNEETVLPAVLGKLSEKDAGIVTIARIMKQKKSDKTFIEEPIPFIGGGYCLKKRVWDISGGFDNSAGEEKSFGLNIYLAGYKNYRCNICRAKHEQNSAKSGGGIAQQLKDYKTEQGEAMEKLGTPKVFEMVDYLEVKPEFGKYGENRALGVSIKYKLTKTARELHNKNNKTINEN